MDNILVSLGLDPADTTLYLVVALVFGAVALIAIGIGNYSSSRRAMRARAAGKTTQSANVDKNGALIWRRKPFG